MAKARFMKGEHDDQKLATFVRMVLANPRVTPAERRLAREEIADIDLRAEAFDRPREDWSDLPG
jgi:hypothetical protein